jgi:exodeoxyribonuclease-5
MSFSQQQGQAIQAVRKWLDDPKAPQVFRLFGFAGTGKTTIARELANEVKGSVHFACFTGKAALVLRKKGCFGASTIHSLIYEPIRLPGGGVEFELKEDSAASAAALLVIDEVSMVGEDIALDLLSFGCKVLVLGDPAQLPPVFGEGFFINATPDFMLTEVHRQAQDNPIIRMSMDVREGRGLTVGQYGSSAVVPRFSLKQSTLQEMLAVSDQVLCGTNRTRQSLNTLIRGQKGLIGDHNPAMPTVGDRLVCLKNKKDKNLFNGGLFDVLSVANDDSFSQMEVRSLDEDVDTVNIQVPSELFIGSDKKKNWYDHRLYEEFTYGWSLTVHKSQGSQWDNVTVFDESATFKEHAAKHLYTAITRAAEKVTVIV